MLAQRKAYQDDLSDQEWDLIKPYIKEDAHFGPKSRSKYSRREMLNAIFYVLRSGCAWRDLPHDFPPWKSVYAQYLRWRNKNVFEQVHTHVRRSLRQLLNRLPDATVGIADSQSVKTTEKKGSAAMMEVKKLKVGKDTYWLITLD